jgi:hypothetical protein
MRLLTLFWRHITGRLELLDGHMRVLRKEDHVPVVVAHGRRAIAAVRIQKSSKQLAVVPMLCWRERRGRLFVRVED